MLAVKSLPHSQPGRETHHASCTLHEAPYRTRKHSYTIFFPEGMPIRVLVRPDLNTA